MNQSVFLIGTDYDGVTHSDWVLLDSNVNATQIASGFGGYIVYAQVGSSPEEEEEKCIDHSAVVGMAVGIPLAIIILTEIIVIFIIWRNSIKLENKLMYFGYDVGSFAGDDWEPMKGYLKAD